MDCDEPVTDAVVVDDSAVAVTVIETDTVSGTELTSSVTVSTTVSADGVAEAAFVTVA